MRRRIEGEEDRGSRGRVRRGSSRSARRGREGESRVGVDRRLWCERLSGGRKEMMRMERTVKVARGTAGREIRFAAGRHGTTALATVCRGGAGVSALS